MLLLGAAVLSIPYFHALHYGKLAWPQVLACDYSRDSIPLPDTIFCTQVLYTVAVYAAVFVVMPLGIWSSGDPALGFSWAMVCAGAYGRVRVRVLLLDALRVHGRAPECVHVSFLNRLSFLCAPEALFIGNYCALACIARTWIVMHHADDSAIHPMLQPALLERVCPDVP
jgi:hypothetical protein